MRAPYIKLVRHYLPSWHIHFQQRMAVVFLGRWLLFFGWPKRR